MISARSGLVALLLLVLGLAQSAAPILIVMDQLEARSAASGAASRVEVEASPSALRDLEREVNGAELLLGSVACLLCLAAAAALIGPRPQEAQEFFWVSVLVDLCLWAALRRSEAYQLALTPGLRLGVLGGLAAAVGLGFGVRACARGR